MHRFSQVMRRSILREILVGMPWFTLAPASTCQLRATELKLALWLFQIEEKRPASSLEELVPTYLPAVPIDPFSGSVFLYRLSKGENIFVWPEVPNDKWSVPSPVPRNTGILWSVGADGNNDGGISQGGPGLRFDPDLWRKHEADWIFLVPPLELKR